MKSTMKTKTSMYFQKRLANGPQVGGGGKSDSKSKRKRLPWVTLQKNQKFYSRTHPSLKLGERERDDQFQPASNTNKRRSQDSLGKSLARINISLHLGENKFLLI